MFVISSITELLKKNLLSQHNNRIITISIFDAVIDRFEVHNDYKIDSGALRSITLQTS